MREMREMRVRDEREMRVRDEREMRERDERERLLLMFPFPCWLKFFSACFR